METESVIMRNETDLFCFMMLMSILPTPTLTQSESESERKQMVCSKGWIDAEQSIVSIRVALDEMLKCFRLASLQDSIALSMSSKFDHARSGWFTLDQPSFGIVIPLVNRSYCSHLSKVHT